MYPLILIWVGNLRQTFRQSYILFLNIEIKFLVIIVSKPYINQRLYTLDIGALNSRIIYVRQSIKIYRSCTKSTGVRSYLQ